MRINYKRTERESDIHLRPLADEEMEKLPSYRYIVIDAAITAEYTARGAWAHTIPNERRACFLPPERTDPYLPVEVHEILHNLYPELPEETIHSMAFDASYRQEARSRARIKYR